MTEACKSILHFAFTILGAQKIHTDHHVDNPASGKVLLRAGLRYVRTEYQNLADYKQIIGDYYCY